MKRFFWVCLSVLAVSSCTETNSDKPVNDADSSAVKDTTTNVKPPEVVRKDSLSPLFRLTESDKKLLTLAENVGIGFSFDEAKKLYPELKGIRPESNKDFLAEEGYTESVATMNLLSGDSKWEINYKDDSVYYHTFSCQKSEEEAPRAYDALLVFYKNKYGEPNPDPTEEENTYSQTKIWVLKDNTTLFIKYDMNTGQIFWGRRIDRAL